MNCDNCFSIQSMGKKYIHPLSKTGYFYKILSSARNGVGHTILVLDGSASLLSQLEKLKELVLMTIHQLNKNHRLSILLFGNEDEVKWLIQYEQVLNREELILFIHKQLELHCGDEWSVLSSALEEVFIFFEALHHDGNTQCIIVTDGQLYSKKLTLTVEQHRCYQWLLDYRQHYIVTHVVGMGEIQVEFLNQLAIAGQLGSYYPYTTMQNYRVFFKEWKFQLNHMTNKEIDILNYDYFLFLTKKRYTHPKRIGVVPQIIVTFDAPLCLSDGDIVESSTDLMEVEQDLLRFYSYDLLTRGQINEAAIILQQTKWFEMIHQGYSKDEVSQSLVSLATNRVSKMKSRACSVIDVLNLIVADPLTEIYYEIPIYTSSISGVSVKEISYRYLKVDVLIASHVTQDVFLTVKARENGVLLEREYPLIRSGNLMIDTLICKLSPQLKKRFKEYDLLLNSINKIGFDYVALSRLKVAHFKVYQEERVLDELYFLTCLCLKEDMIRERLKKLGVKTKSFRQKQLLKHSSIAARDRIVQESFEWRIENFPIDKEKKRLYEEIECQLLSTSLTPTTYLLHELAQTEEEWLRCHNHFYLTRLEAILSGQTLFSQMKVPHRVYESVQQSRQKVGDFTILENKYLAYLAT